MHAEIFAARCGDECTYGDVLVTHARCAFRRSARRGRLTAKTMAKVRSILDEAIAKLDAVGDE